MSAVEDIILIVFKRDYGLRVTDYSFADYIISTPIRRLLFEYLVLFLEFESF